MKFAKKYVPVDRIADDVFECKFSDLPCLRTRGLAAGENDGAEEVFLYFPIPEGCSDYSEIDYGRAIAVFTAADGSSYTRDAEIAGYDEAVEWLAGDSGFYRVITAFRQDSDDDSLLTYCRRRMDALRDGEALSDDWTEDEVNGAYAFYESLYDRFGGEPEE